MATRGQNVLSLSHLSVLLLAIALLLLNAAAARSSTRLDLTEDRLWTLSSGTEQVLGGLKDPATIRVFWKDVPQTGESEADRRFLASLLDEMRSAAKGNLVVRWVDLEDEDGEKERDDLHVQPIQVQSVSQGEISMKNSYQTVVIEHGANEPERLEPLINRRGEYEYEIASALHRMSRGQMPGIGLVAPRAAFDQFGGGRPGGRFSVLSDALRRQFGSIARTWMSLDEPIAEDVQVLIVAAPEALEAKQAWNLEQFALRGGKVVLLLDPVNKAMLEQSHGVGTPALSGLEDWLAHLGVTVERAAVAEFASDAMLKYPRVNRRGQFEGFSLFPYWVVARSPNMDQSVPATREFDRIPFFWPSPITVDTEKAKAAGRTVAAIVRTSQYAWKQADVSALDRLPEQPREEDLTTYNLAVLVQGPLDSFWKGKPSPVEEEKSKEEKSKKDEEERKKKEEEAKNAEPPKPAEAVPGEPKKEEGKPEEPKPAEPQPSEPKPEEKKPDDAKPEDKKPEEPKPEEPKGPARIDQGKVTLLIVGDAELVADDPAAATAQQIPIRLGYEHGFQWMGNVLDWLTGSEALLELRARSDKPRTLDKVEPSTQNLLALANIGGVPVLLLFAGIVVFLVRKYGK